MYSFTWQLLTRKTIVIVAVLFVLLGMAACNMYEDRALDNKSHNTPCVELPTVAEAQQTLDEHHESVTEILNINPGYIFVDLDTLSCPGKASLIISYPSHDNRRAIENLIEGRDFFGIPYDLRNR